MARYVRIKDYNGQEHYARQEEETLHLLNRSPLEGGQATGGTYALGDVRLLTPCSISKAVCVGLNYRRHAGELEMEVPEEPCIFLKPCSAVIGPGDNIIRWSGVERLDYEAELCVVIGRECFGVREEEAQDYIFGYTAGNDVTARDLQAKDKQWTRSKGFNTFLPFGPAIVTGLDPSNLRVRSILNGKVCQDDTTASLIFPVPKLVSFISQVMTLYPGDLIMTGTPVGVGAMKPGDTITVEVEGVGSLTNRVAPPPRQA